MSRASAKAYFKDWTILHWIYNWTSDVYIPKLYVSKDNIRDEFYKRYRDDEDVWYNFEYEWWEECVLYDYYWEWDFYIGRASKEDMCINRHCLDIDDLQNISKESAEPILWYTIED
jgi:hypothetical protein